MRGLDILENSLPMRLVRKVVILFRFRIVCKMGLAYWIFKYAFIKLFWGSKVANSKITNINQLILPDFLRFKGCSIGTKVVINEGLKLLNLRDFKKLEIGENVHVGCNCTLDLRDEIKVSDNVVISMGVTILTHMDMSNSELSSMYPAESAPVNIQNSAYIGAGSTILMGVTVGEKALVGANSLVNKDCEPLFMYFGVPARKIKGIR